MPELIYVVDDESSIIDTVQFALEREGFLVRTFNTGKACMAALASEQPAIILLDVGLPDGSGFDFFRQYRESSKAPVIFLTARNDEIDRVVGLEMGAEDYIAKPFSLRELVARVRVVLRRKPGDDLLAATVSPPANRSQADQVFHLDDARKQVHYHQVALVLTAQEYRLLKTLLSQPGRVFSRAQLLDHTWDAPEHRLERTIDTHIKTLRSKLHQIKADAEPLRTHRGLGYSLELE